jgi:hypothetical protein
LISRDVPTIGSPSIKDLKLCDLLRQWTDRWNNGVHS